ncbi:MAG: hypothetical protein GXP41_11975 [Chloroflexi bacterium]|nr:hypothetical protein [Chloroflexota bacterium]
MGTPITQPKLLLVEGKDEVKLFEKLISDLGLVDIEIRSVLGKTKFRDNIATLPRLSGFGQVVSLGMVRDADKDPSGAFSSLRDALEAAGLPRPTKPLQSAGDTPKVTVMILPDRERQGMLEDICLDSVREDPAMLCVDQYFQCLSEQIKDLPHNLAKARVRAFLASMEWLEETHFEYFQQYLTECPAEPSRIPSVAKAHVFLASRYKPDLDLGIAAKAGYWRLDNPAFEQVRQFLKTL